MIKTCKAFSGIATRRKVYWKAGLDSHDVIVERFKLKDDELGRLIPFQIAPKNGNYINPEWVFRFDDGCPDWWKSSHEKMCWEAFKKWKLEVYSKMRLREMRNLVHPFRLKAPQITKKHIKLLAEWASVEASVRDSVGASVEDSVGASVEASVEDSVGASVEASVGASVWASVWASVGDSVWASVWAYIGSLFKLSRNQWKYTNTSRIKTKDYPFQPAVKLWKMGLVSSFDGKIWRLHGGKKAKVLFEISKEDLKGGNYGRKARRSQDKG